MSRQQENAQTAMTAGNVRPIFRPARLLGGASALALTAALGVAFTAAAPAPANAVECVLSSGASVSVASALVCGDGANATGVRSLAVGNNSDALGLETTAVGGGNFGAFALADFSTAIGSEAIVPAASPGGTAVGASADGDAFGAIATGIG
ncbi:MAG: hypothetical protein IIB62_10935, partial [Proteobacteria bacterium]|nr:hypothetical protein [Pseudomonadota bacterium]